MEIVNPLAQTYAEQFTSAEDVLLREISDFTSNTHPKAHMLSGHLQGKFLQMISCMMQPKYVLEIGTFTGYSALCLAEGLQPDGELHTIEMRENDANSAAGFFKKSKFSKQLHLHIGDAIQIIGELDHLWDLVFVDADKVNYIDYFNRVLPKVRQGGIILADNVLFHGQVLEEEIKGKNAKAIQAFNEFVASRNDVEKLMLPVRDGLYLIRKL
jgi:predicted O-methyltransferase YrrM